MALAHKLQHSTPYTVVWWALEGIALPALLLGAYAFGPPMKRNRNIGPEFAVELAVPLAAIALIALILLAAIPVPASVKKHGAGVFANVTGILVLLLLGYRLLVGIDDSRGFSQDLLTPGLPLLWLACIPLVVLVIRLEIIRRRDEDTQRWRGSRGRRRR